jgi:hypothetical protein
MAYLEFVVATLQTVSNDMNTLGFLFSQPAFDDEYWVSSATVVLNRIEKAHGAIATLQPTPRLQPFQDASEEALAHCGEFAGIIRDLLVQRQTELSDEAAAELMAAAESFGRAEELLNEFLEAHPLPQVSTRLPNVGSASGQHSAGSVISGCVSASS